jgi:hypothetical protein
MESNVATSNKTINAHTFDLAILLLVIYPVSLSYLNVGKMTLYTSISYSTAFINKILLRI